MNVRRLEKPIIALRGARTALSALTSRKSSKDAIGVG